jgi:hypothetical protein
MNKLYNALIWRLEQYNEELNMMFPELESHVSKAKEIPQLIIGKRRK